MTSAWSHHQLQELLAAYALDAVDGDEAEAVELHLRECPRCRAEVAEHRETASLLASGHTPAPVGVWDSIAAVLEEEERPSGAAPILSMDRRWRRAAGVAVSSVAAALIAVLGVRVVEQGQQLDRVQGALQDRTVLRSALAAQAHPDARRVDLRAGDGAVLAQAVLTPDGTGFVLGDALPPVAPDRTYQLWALAGPQPVSAGILGARPGVSAFRVALPVDGFAITAEAAPGAQAPTTAPAAAGFFRES